MSREFIVRFEHVYNSTVSDYGNYILVYFANTNTNTNIQKTLSKYGRN